MLENVTFTAAQIVRFASQTEKTPVKKMRLDFIRPNYFFLKAQTGIAKLVYLQHEKDDFQEHKGWRLIFMEDGWKLKPGRMFFRIEQ